MGEGKRKRRPTIRSVTAAKIFDGLVEMMLVGMMLVGMKPLGMRRLSQSLVQPTP
jgi:hypothetical protein